MSILVWNVRRFNKKGRRKDVIDHVHKFDPSIVALVETREGGKMLLILYINLILALFLWWKQK